MDGGTVFHFVSDGIHAALTRASEAAQGRDIRLGGGVATIRQYLRAALIDEIHVAISPALLGSGEHLLAGIDAPKRGYQCTEHVATANGSSRSHQAQMKPARPSCRPGAGRSQEVRSRQLIVFESRRSSDCR